MIPSEKGWIKSYLDLRPQHIGVYEVDSTKSAFDQWHSYVQTTGFCYGHPILFPPTLPLDYQLFSMDDRIKVIYLESYLSAFLILQKKTISTPELVDEALTHLQNYITNLWEIKDSKWKLFSAKKKDSLDFIEQFVQHRIRIKAEWYQTYWRGFFQNFDFYIDVLAYGLSFTDNPSKPIVIQKQLMNVTQQLSYSPKSERAVQVLLKDLQDTFLYPFRKNKKQKEERIRYFEKKSNFEKVENLRIASDFGYLIQWLNTSHLKAFKSQSLETVSYDNAWIDLNLFVLNHYENLRKLKSKQNYLILKNRFIRILTTRIEPHIPALKLQLESNKMVTAYRQLHQKRGLSNLEKEHLLKEYHRILFELEDFKTWDVPSGIFSIFQLEILFPLPELLPTSPSVAPRNPNKKSMIVDQIEGN